MNWPWVSRKKYEYWYESYWALQNPWTERELDWIERVESARVEGANSVRKELREWMVDLNYEIYHSSDNTAKQKMYGALTDGARQFKVSI